MNTPPRTLLAASAIWPACCAIACANWGWIRPLRRRRRRFPMRVTVSITWCRWPRRLLNARSTALKPLSRIRMKWKKARKRWLNAGMHGLKIRLSWLTPANWWAIRVNILAMCPDIPALPMRNCLKSWWHKISRTSPARLSSAWWMWSRKLSVNCWWCYWRTFRNRAHARSVKTTASLTDHRSTPPKPA